MALDSLEIYSVCSSAQKGLATSGSQTEAWSTLYPCSPEYQMWMSLSHIFSTCCLHERASAPSKLQQLLDSEEANTRFLQSNFMDSIGFEVRMKLENSWPRYRVGDRSMIASTSTS